MEKIVIFGSGGHAKVIADIFRKQGRYVVAGFVSQSIETSDLSPLILESDLEKHGIRQGIVAIGDNWTRAQVVKNISKNFPGFKFISAIHTQASISDSAVIGQGTVIMPGAVVGPDTRVGAHCILNTNSALDHDSSMEDFSSLAPGATCGGLVQIGAFSAVGLNAGVVHNIRIGDHTLLGAGSITLEDVQDFCVAYGVPSKVVRKREIGSKYL